MGLIVNKPTDFDKIKMYDERLNYAIKISEEWHNKPTDYSKCHCCGTEWPSLVFKKMSPVLVLHNSIIIGYSICPRTRQPVLHHLTVYDTPIDNYYAHTYSHYIVQVQSENKNGTE